MWSTAELGAVAQAGRGGEWRGGRGCRAHGNAVTLYFKGSTSEDRMHKEAECDNSTPRTSKKECAKATKQHEYEHETTQWTSATHPPSSASTAAWKATGTGSGTDTSASQPSHSADKQQLDQHPPPSHVKLAWTSTASPPQPTDLPPRTTGRQSCQGHPPPTRSAWMVLAAPPAWMWASRVGGKPRSASRPVASWSPTRS